MLWYGQISEVELYDNPLILKRIFVGRIQTWICTKTQWEEKRTHSNSSRRRSFTILAHERLFIAKNESFFEKKRLIMFSETYLPCIAFSWRDLRFYRNICVLRLCKSWKRSSCRLSLTFSSYKEIWCEILLKRRNFESLRIWIFRCCKLNVSLFYDHSVIMFG